MPLPSRSTDRDVGRLSTRGNAGDVAARCQPLPDWLKYSAHAVAVEIDDVGDARAVDVGQADAPLVRTGRARRTTARRPW